MEVDIPADVPCSSSAVNSIIRMGTAGLIWGSCSGPYEASKLGLAGINRASFIAKSVGRFGFQWGLFAAIFSSTRCGLQRYRRRNDWVNVLTAGVVAGAAFGAGTRNWKQVAGATVNRIEARSGQFDMYMLLDVNTEIYPMRVKEKFMMVLASTLNLDGTPDTGYFIQGNKKSLADKFEYIMHGKLYRISEEGSGKHVKADIFVSFGGLLMQLRGDPSIAAKFELDQKLFLLLRKV